MKIFSAPIPGLAPGKTNTDFPVLLPFKGHASGQTGDLRFSRWMVSASPMVMMMIAVLALLIPSVAAAQSKFNLADAFEVLWRWLPFIVGSGPERIPRKGRGPLTGGVHYDALAV